MSRAVLPGRSSRRRAGVLIGVLTAATVLAACSTGGDRTTDSEGASAASSAAAATAAASSPPPGTTAPSGSDEPASDTGSYQPTEPGVADTSGADVGGEPAAITDATPASGASQVATAPVAPPTAGDVNQTVADQPVVTLPAVPVTGTGDFGTGVTAAVGSLERIDAVGRGPGEISGPALSYRLSLTNGTGADLDLSTVSVNVQDGAGTPFSQIDNDPAVPFTGILAPGQSATATYVFTLPSDYTAPATLSLAYSASAPIVLFAGDAQ